MTHQIQTDRSPVRQGRSGGLPGAHEMRSPSKRKPNSPAHLSAIEHMDSYEDLIYTCRACLSNEPELTLHPLTDDRVRELYTSCTLLQVAEEDGLPQNICAFCLEKCETWTAFREACTENENLMRSHLQHDFEDIVIDDGVYIVIDDGEYNQDEPDPDPDPNPDPDPDPDPDLDPDSNTVELIQGDIEVAANVESDILDDVSAGDNEEVTAECQTCDVKFDNDRTYNDHLRKHHKKPKATKNQIHACVECEMRCKSALGLKNHMATHSEVKAFSCEKCGQHFKHKMNWKAHIKRHDGVKKHVCTVCDKAFFWNSELKDHTRRMHSEERMHGCDECDKAFLKPSLLRHHKRVHSGEKPFQCEVCKAAFKNTITLRDHRRIHTGEKPFLCHICSRGFRKRNTLRVHMNTHNRNTISG